MNEEKKVSLKTKKDFLRWIIAGLAGFAVIVLIFAAGIMVGGMKAKFSYRWAENYHKNFAGPRGGFSENWRKLPPMPGDFIEGHGVFGEIIEIKDNGFVVNGRGEMEKIVITTEETVIKKGRETIQDGLKIGDRVVIIGSPNEAGQIEAKLIRLFGEESEGSLLPRRGLRIPFLN